MFKIIQDKIIMDDEFDKPLYTIFDILVLKPIVVFGRNFNQNLELLPPNINQIYLGKNFNKYLYNLPPTIKSIIFANDSIYNNSIDDLNDNIKELILGDNYNYKINKLPFELEKLVLGKTYQHKIYIFPKMLIYLDIGESYEDSLDNLPDNLETLIISGKFNNYIKYPSKLKNLIFSENCMYNREIQNLPNSLIYFELKNKYSYNIGSMPISVLCMSIGNYFNGNIIFPNNLYKLILSKKFKNDLVNLPNSLKIIELFDDYPFISILKYKYPHIEFKIKCI